MQESRFNCGVAVFQYERKPKTERASDRITEGIINSLSQACRSQVMSRSTVIRYKGKELDAQRISTSWGVRTVLVGTVNAMANTVRRKITENVSVHFALL